MAEPVIRPATPADAAAVQAIYAFHVAHGTASFDTEAPDVAFWEEKIAHILGRGWPFLAIEVDGVVAGYAYASQFRDRAAYAHTCENSIYVAPDLRGTGLGTRLLGALLAAARDCGFEQVIAVIGGGEPASVALHARLGFAHAGRMKNVGNKFGRRLDTVYMQYDLTAESPEESQMSETFIDPSPANFARFKNLPRDEPIHMLNLLLYRDLAEYPEGHGYHGNGWTGRRAYQEYGKTSGPIFRRVGGTIVWRGAFQTMVTGPDAMRWDDGFVAQYPNSVAFFEMIKDPDYQLAVVNRTAALTDSRLIRFKPGAGGEGFG